MKLVIGAGRKPDPNGWTCTERHELDLLAPATWPAYLQGRPVEAAVCEAVWEHLSIVDGLRAAATVYQFLQPGGYLRAAVPDGLHPDRAYIDWVRPGGTGAGAADHQVLYDYHAFGGVFRAAGFRVKLLEWWDEASVFHARHWDPAAGFIERSLRFDPRNANGAPHYTSIILDAFKEAL